MNDSGHRTILALDFGLRQIGVAVGNSATQTTQALRVIKAKEGIPQWSQVQALVDEWRPDLLLVGDPLNMDGSDSDMSQRARKFARRLQGRTGLPVAMADERLTSFEAKQDARQRGHRGDYSAVPVDSFAAELILRGWLARA
ncbi:MAG: Holliday junction resolvase RuvX [Halioglobus sp.]|nr:Holliday junction resolvase RuvX [Halioglobus sp.]